MDSERSARPAVAGTVAQLQGAAKRYGPVRALEPLDLAVRSGEIVGVLGPNGAGKTTALSLLLGLRSPSEGAARLFGLPPRHRAARGRTGAMLQVSGVPEALTVTEILDLVRATYPRTLPRGEILARADLADKARARVGDLSGGQRQRLCFALSIAGDPDLLFLDEPTAAMDPAARRAFWGQVREFAALGKTVLFTTHYLEEAEAAGRLLLFRAGRVLAEGTPDEIRARAAGRVMRLRTSAPRAWLAAQPETLRLEPDGEHLRLYGNAPEALLERIFAAGHRVLDLSVRGAELEDAFLTLTADAPLASGSGPGPAPEGAAA